MYDSQLTQERRKASIWTRIHPLFAIGQLGVFFVSVVLLVLSLFHKVDFHVVHISVLIKVAMMVGAVFTGSFWEHDVYGQWWFAIEFLHEDVMTVNVFALHILYLVLAYTQPTKLSLLYAVLSVAYAVYALNVAQYVIRTMQRSQQTLSELSMAA